MNLKPYVYLIISLGIIYLLFRKKTNLLQVYLFLLPFNAWFIDIGLNLKIIQLVVIIMLFHIIFTSPKFVLPKAKNRYLKTYITYAITITVLMSVFFIKEYINAGGYFRSEGRFLAQIVLLFLNFLIIPLSLRYIKTISNIYPLLKIYIYSLLILVALGYIQMFFFFSMGLDIFPLNIREDGTARTGLWAVASTHFIRMSSLGGEPKNFSMSLVIGYFVIAVANYHKIYITKRDSLTKMLFLTTSFLTLSTSGIIMFFILQLFFILFKLRSFTKTIKISVRNIVITILIISSLGIIYKLNSDIIHTALKERIFERNITSEDFDYPIQLFLKDNPEYLFFGSGLGNIHNLAFPYIPAENLHYMDNHIFLAKSGYLRLISELGIIGFILFSAIVVQLYLKYKRVRPIIQDSYKGILNSIFLLLILLYIAYLARAYMTNELILFISIANALLLLIRNNNKQSTPTIY